LVGAGPVTFEALMEAALWHPEYGYYARQVRGLGTSGDFTTVPERFPLLGECLAKLYVQEARRLAEPGLPVIEIGGGSGALAKSFLMALPEAEQPKAFVAVERSPMFQSQQAEQLQPLLPAGAFTCVPTLPEALAITGADSFTFSNELVDAFAAVQLCFKGGFWHEVCHRFEASGMQEVLVPLQQGFDASVPANAREGDRVFCHRSYHRWLAQTAHCWKAGAWVTIDYGRHQPSRACRAYAGHQRYEGLAALDHLGERDLTCDVNFSDLRRWGEQLGWQTTVDQPLYAFVEACGISPAPEAEAARLLNPLDAGGAFHVLVQQAGQSKCP
jgi:SAM-dependent MidA family methyltransferase